MTLVEALPWILSITTLTVNWLAGSKWTYTYVIALFGQVLWFLWIFLSGNYGFIILSTFLTVIYIRNHIRWIHEAREKKATIYRAHYDA